MSKSTTERNGHDRQQRMLCRDGEIEIVTDAEVWSSLAETYDIPTEEVGLIDFNRTGVSLPNGEVPVRFRVRFNGELLYPDGPPSWYALPVRLNGDTAFSVADGELRFGDTTVGSVGELFLDTCESSYQRGPHLLNLNSRSRSNCGGCRACVHNYKNLYDSTVLHDQEQLVTRADMERFFDEKQATGLDVTALQQIAVVTGLFGSEDAVIEHMQLLAETVRARGFSGELMYFGCEVNSDEGLDAFADIGHIALVYAVDNFTKRDRLLAKVKAGMSLADAKDTMQRAKDRGIETTFAYIAGVDPIDDLVEGFELFKDAITRFPVVNIYQVQTTSQVKVMEEGAKRLEYYVQARRAIEEVMADTPLRPKRWENYRPLWYRSFNGEELENNPYGDL